MSKSEGSALDAGQHFILSRAAIDAAGTVNQRALLVQNSTRIWQNCLVQIKRELSVLFGP